MPVNVERIPGWNGGRVLTIEGGGAVGAPRPGGMAVRMRVLVVGTEATIRQGVGGMGGVAGVVIAGAVRVASAECPVPSAQLGVPELGETSDLPMVAARYGVKTALVCVPAGMREERERVADALRQAGIEARWVVAMEDVLGGTSVDVPPPSSLRSDTSPAGAGEGGRQHRFAGAAPSIDLAALIGRKPYEMDRGAISAILRGKCVMITGAGGSIGAELAKVAAGFEPSLLVLMERAENALFEIDRQIARHFPGVQRKAVLHDVVDAEATLRLCEKLRPHAVFHAAAHKHVPLMEDHPAHAVTNNLFGTKSIADAAVACGAERFVMISSDKAVNPTSVMGGTKRLAEMYVRGIGAKKQGSMGAEGAGERGTRLSMVRFGNVLGSAASVLTIWAQQIAEGGPITITDPRMTRYFMTIPEAATLVVQSATLDVAGAAVPPPSSLRSDTSPARAGEVGVFVLDMGEPVRIVDLARRFVRAHGFEPREVGKFGPQVAIGAGRTQSLPGCGTIDLSFTGIRPGEKLHEELAYAAEQLRPTAHPGIRAWAGPGFGADVAAGVREMVAELDAARFDANPARVVEAIRRHVPEMRSAQISPEQAAILRAG